MSYFAIDNYGLSHLVNQLKVNKTYNYNAQTNAAGDTVIDFINQKYNLEVGFRPMEDVEMKELQEALQPFNIVIDFRDPQTGAIKQISCIAPQYEVEYYTIQDNRVMYKEFSITFTEL